MHRIHIKKTNTPQGDVRMVDVVLKAEGNNPHTQTDAMWKPKKYLAHANQLP